MADINANQNALIECDQEKLMSLVESSLNQNVPAAEILNDAITDAGLRDEIKIMIGGAPVTHSFADEIAADGFAPDAGSAAKLAKAFAAA